MEYLTVTYSAGARMGISVVPAASRGLTEFGSTVVETADPSGPSKLGGVAPGDYLVAVNDKPVAFDRTEDVIGLLKKSVEETKQYSVTFSRLTQERWQQIHASGEAAIKEGQVKKLHQGFFVKWNVRHLKLTRTTVSYASEGVLKGKFSVESDVDNVKVAAGYPHQQGVFEFKCGDKVMVIQAGSAQERNEWIHSITCAKNRCFARPPQVGMFQPTMPPPPVQSIHQSQSEQPIDGFDAYLQMGRAALSRQSNERASQMSKPTSAPSGNGAEPAGVYRILSLSKLQARGGPDQVVSLEGLKNPGLAKISVLSYDFKLEESVVATQS